MRTIQRNHKLAIVLALVLVTACAPKVIHTGTVPGAYAKFDSDAYDTLHVLQDAIANTQTQLDNKVLPETFRPVLKVMKDAFNNLSPAYKAWHNAAMGGTSTTNQLQQLQDFLTAANAALATFRGTK